MSDERKATGTKRRGQERSGDGAPEDFTMDMLSRQHAAAKGGQLAADRARSETASIVEDTAESGADNAGGNVDDQR